MGLMLESFDAAPPEPVPEEPAGPSAEWREGFAAGHAEGLSQGRAEAEAESAHLSAELARGLQDMAFGYAEARGQVLAALRPLVELLIERLLPQLAAEALGPWIAQAVLDAARADSAAPLVVDLHPDRIEAVRACLPPGMPATLRPDPALGPNAARLSTLHRESDLDIDACLGAIREALSALIDTSPGLLRHG
ncbi:hypothetical protein [Rubellimicrobium aerolatum]|uniref:Flagellar biosynthesis protein n=1 Tax=Rubellimicrobium aerolatum TaxID=490979 RepID=A0ABW0SA06_9RHOB|nr:hypothetical protein [Rubellimicrobium aerolatum]MBP1805085.1 flagellar assembly protein FliH [Rubellimicrobium aerolatum]